MKQFKQINVTATFSIAVETSYDLQKEMCFAISRIVRNSVGKEWQEFGIGISPVEVTIMEEPNEPQTEN